MWALVAIVVCGVRRSSATYADIVPMAIAASAAGAAVWILGSAVARSGRGWRRWVAPFTNRTARPNDAVRPVTA